ncbi:hypothetical protein BKA64DRAFT_639889 [Cadophora sp. MPI-SDFR-AT-0126]|nr:hypothetical protein BKA64DRAFT_639889 [Leotiomycetes sp. MPI-SDFR-AT-0126]
MGEEHSSLSCAFYSAKLIWRVAGQTRVVVSVLRSSRGVRSKVRSQDAVAEENEKEGYWDEHSEKDYFSVTPPAKKKRPTSQRSKNSCYLCKLKYKKVDGNEFPVPPRTPDSPKTESSSIKYLPITRTQPPKPPHRSTSLPYFKQLRRLAFTAHPSAPLLQFTLSQHDGVSLQWLVLGQADKNGLHEFMDPIWDLVLQVCHVEPRVRHAVLAVAALGQNFRYGSGSWDSLCSRDRLHIIRHYMTAIRGLQDRLSGVLGKADSLTWEISFIAAYLFTVLQIALRNTSGAYFWLKAGYRILKMAFRAFGQEIHGRTLPASMRDVARAFGRLDTRSIGKRRVG